MQEQQCRKCIFYYLDPCDGGDADGDGDGDGGDDGGGGNDGHLVETALCNLGWNVGSCLD